MQNSNYPRRKNPRLTGFDYSENDCYFITICTDQKRPIFGEPEHLNPFGKIAQEALLQIPKHFPAMQVEKYVVMPNHVHIMILLQESEHSVSTAIGLYKSHVTKEIHAVDPKLKVWQASFHDHIIRNRQSYEKIWEYIDTNPAKWMDDCFYTQSTT